MKVKDFVEFDLEYDQMVNMQDLTELNRVKFRSKRGKNVFAPWYISNLIVFKFLDSKHYNLSFLDYVINNKKENIIIAW